MALSEPRAGPTPFAEEVPSSQIIALASCTCSYECALTTGISGIASCKLNAALRDGWQDKKAPVEISTGLLSEHSFWKNTLGQHDKKSFCLPRILKRRVLMEGPQRLVSLEGSRVLEALEGTGCSGQKHKTSRTEDSCMRDEWTQATVHLGMTEEMMEEAPLHPRWADGENVGYVCLERLLPEGQRWPFGTCIYWGLLVLDLEDQSTSPKSELLTVIYFPFCLAYQDISR